MAKQKQVYPIKNGSYGKIVKKESSGMFLTNKGHRIPPFNGYKIGDEVVVENSKYKIGDSKSKDVIDTDTLPSKEDFQALMKRVEDTEKKNKELEEKLGEKGSSIKGGKADE